jgi:hypothetical protein
MAAALHPDRKEVHHDEALRLIFGKGDEEPHQKHEPEAKDQQKHNHLSPHQNHLQVFPQRGYYDDNATENAGRQDRGQSPNSSYRDLKDSRHSESVRGLNAQDRFESPFRKGALKRM